MKRKRQEAQPEALSAPVATRPDKAQDSQQDGSASKQASAKSARIPESAHPQAAPAELSRAATRRHSSRLARSIASLDMQDKHEACKDSQQQQCTTAPMQQDQSGCVDCTNVEQELPDVAGTTDSMDIPDSQEAETAADDKDQAAEQAAADISQPGQYAAADQHHHVQPPDHSGRDTDQLGQVDRLPDVAAAVLIPGGSSRFSTRRLRQQTDIRLPVSKATPVGLPPTPLVAPVPQ